MGQTPSLNPAYTSWVAADQRALILIQSSLSKESMAETLGHTTSHAIWTALESTYRHDSLKCTHTLRDSLNHLKKGSSTVCEYAQKFKSICDQLTVIGHPLDENDKSHWFLCGLGSSFEMFSMTQLALVAFNVTSSRGSNTSSSARGRERSYTCGGSNRGRGHGNRHHPHCQLCKKYGHYANQCPDLYTFARQPSTLDANLAEAFQVQCHTSSPDWFVDTGASVHMTSSLAHLDASTSYSDNEYVFF
ncbi:putative RNA-directed DNA polymerase [Tanacetum coccineum]